MRTLKLMQTIHEGRAGKALGDTMLPRSEEVEDFCGSYKYNCKHAAASTNFGDRKLGEVVVTFVVTVMH